MVVFHDNNAASKAFHAVSTGSVSAAVEAEVTVEWLQPTADAATSSSFAPDPARHGEPIGEGGENAASSASADGTGASTDSNHDAASQSSNQGSGQGANREDGGSSAGQGAMPSFASWQPGGGATDDSILSHRDYESITLMRCLSSPPHATPACAHAPGACLSGPFSSCTPVCTVRHPGATIISMSHASFHVLS